MKDFKFEISNCGLLAAECGETCFCTSWTRGSASLHLTAPVKQSLGPRKKRVIPRRGDAEGSHEYSHYRQNIFSFAQILMRGPSLSSQLGMTEEMNSE
jgi:hypothetical protein